MKHRNAIARDLRSPKYRKRVVLSKKEKIVILRKKIESIKAWRNEYA